jgi:hypothetical protein
MVEFIWLQVCWGALVTTGVGAPRGTPVADGVAVRAARKRARLWHRFAEGAPMFSPRAGEKHASFRDALAPELLAAYWR